MFTARCRSIAPSTLTKSWRGAATGAVSLKHQGAEVVAGEEVMTIDGELIGLFLTEVIPPGLPASEAAARIKSQGGLIYLEHPYDPYRRHLSEEAIEGPAEMIDSPSCAEAKS